MAPTASQTMSSQKGDAKDLAMPAGVRKMPTAMASPATTAAAEPRPSWRRRGSSAGEVIPVADGILQRKRTAPCVCVAPARKMISLGALRATLLLRAGVYCAECGTARDPDGESAA